MRVAIRSCILGGAVVTALVLAGASAADASRSRGEEYEVALTGAEKLAIEGFETRIGNYLKLHRKLQATLPRHGRHPTPEQADENRRALGTLISTARGGARQGEFFTPDMQALIQRTLQSILAESDGGTIKALIMDENPGVADLSVNDRYPESIPLSTMPRRVLERLPKLEEGLEYRFVGERLVLMDAEARVIIDFTGDVLR
jgi:hypothetical protein